MSEPALKAHAQNTEDEPAVFIVRRPYRWVRHPWYLVAIMLFWSCVDFTSDRLLLNVLWTVWVCLGTRLEQIDLVNFAATGVVSLLTPVRTAAFETLSPLAASASSDQVSLIKSAKLH